jgi:hypothetical protein
MDTPQEWTEFNDLKANRKQRSTEQIYLRQVAIDFYPLP